MEFIVILVVQQLIISCYVLSDGDFTSLFQPVQLFLHLVYTSPVLINCSGGTPDLNYNTCAGCVECK